MLQRLGVLSGVGALCAACAALERLASPSCVPSERSHSSDRDAVLCSLRRMLRLRQSSVFVAAALAYGIFKTDMPTDKTTHVVFVDVGALDTTCSVVGFIKASADGAWLGEGKDGKARVRARACHQHATS